MSKKSNSFILVCFFLIHCIACSEKNTPEKHVIMIGLDGLSLEGYQKAKHPNIDSLFAEGVISTDTRTVMPSVTMPNWTSHLTGGGPEQHGVFDNSWEKTVHALHPQEMDRDGYYPSLFKVVKDNIPNIKTSFYFNWKNLIKPFNVKYLDEVRYEEDDGYDNNYRSAFDFLSNNKGFPTLTFLYSVHVDHAGHQHNWMSPEYITAIEEVDVKIGEFVHNLKAAGLYENTYFLLFTDHGGIGNGHGGITLEEMEVPWMIKGPGIQQEKKLKSPNSNANTAAIVARIFNIRQTPVSWIGKVPAGIYMEN